ncbi:MAG: Vps62-related protein [Candidatus Thermoplasmatota archaeon]|nr:Vps62-related protein [Candidatus Thermoplasmatota archaeon]
MRKTATFLLISTLLCLLFSGVASAQTPAPVADNDSLDDVFEATLAGRFAPILYLHPDEDFYPVSAQYHISRSDLMQAPNQNLIDSSPTATSISVSPYNVPDQGYYLDNTEGTINDQGILNDFRNSKSQFPPMVYARVESMTDGGYMVQYWFFYPFNSGPMNTHEGDWEMIAVRLSPTQSPLYAAYSQHLSGARAQWSLVDKTGNNPHVYVALGSHANYMRPYEGGLGLASDKASDGGRVLQPSQYDLIMLGEPGPGNRPADQAWLDFAGNWGDYGRIDSGIMGERGPLGPAQQDKWQNPEAWAMGLHEMSDDWFLANWFVSNILLIATLIFILALVIKIVLKIRLKKTQGTFGPRLIPFFYLGAQGSSPKRNMGLVFGLLAIIISIAAFTLPWYSVHAQVNVGPFTTGGQVEMLRIDGMSGFQFNRLESGSGLVQVFALPIPFSVFFFLGLAIFFFSTIGMRESSKLGKKLISRGISCIIPVIAIIAVVASIASIVTSAEPNAPPEVLAICNQLSGSPMGGSTVQMIGTYGTVNLSWGLGVGAYLFFAAMALFIISAILLISDKTDFFFVHGSQQPYWYGQPNGVPYGQPPGAPYGQPMQDPSQWPPPSPPGGFQTATPPPANPQDPSQWPPSSPPGGFQTAASQYPPNMQSTPPHAPHPNQPPVPQQPPANYAPPPPPSPRPYQPTPPKGDKLPEFDDDLV